MAKTLFKLRYLFHFSSLAFDLLSGSSFFLRNSFRFCSCTITCQIPILPNVSQALWKLMTPAIDWPPNHSSNTPLTFTFFSACAEVPVTRFVSFANLMKLTSPFSLTPLKGAAAQCVTIFSYHTSSYAVLALLCTRQNILRNVKILICSGLEERQIDRRPNRGLILLNVHIYTYMYLHVVAVKSSATNTSMCYYESRWTRHSYGWMVTIKIALEKTSARNKVIKWKDVIAPLLKFSSKKFGSNQLLPNQKLGTNTL